MTALQALGETWATSPDICTADAIPGCLLRSLETADNDQIDQCILMTLFRF